MLLCSLAMLLLASCKKDAPVAPEAPATPPPVEDPAPPPPPKPQVQAPPPAPVATPEEKDGTFVSVDANGVNVSTKNGSNDSKVTVSKSKKEVKFSTN